MAKAMKSLSVVVFFVLFLALIEVWKVKGQEEECKKIYANYPSVKCLARIYPSLCYHDCKRDKGALSGECVKGDFVVDYKCVCDFCHDPYNPTVDPLDIMEANAAY